MANTTTNNSAMGFSPMSNKVNTLNAESLLSVALPFLYQRQAISRSIVTSVQQVLDTAVKNHDVLTAANVASQRAVLFQSPQGTMKDSQLAARADRLPRATAPISKHELRHRLNWPQLIPADALQAKSDNPDEKRYFKKLNDALVDRGIWLRVDHRWIDAPADTSPAAATSFRAWLSYGADGAEIPTIGGRLTREAIMSVVVIGKGFYDEVYNGTIARKVDEIAQFVDLQVKTGRQLHQELASVRREAMPAVPAVSDALGGTSFPDSKMWELPFALMLEAIESKGNGKLRDATQQATLAAGLTMLCAERLNEYAARSELGAQRATLILNVLRKAGKVAECCLLVYGVYSFAARLLARRAAAEAATAATRRLATSPTMRLPVSQSPTLRGYVGNARTIEQPLGGAPTLPVQSVGSAPTLPIGSAPTLPGSPLSKALAATDADIGRLSTINLGTEAGVNASLEIDALMQERIHAANSYFINSMEHAMKEAGSQWYLNRELGRTAIREVGDQMDAIFGKLRLPGD